MAKKTAKQRRYFYEALDHAVERLKECADNYCGTRDFILNEDGEIVKDENGRYMYEEWKPYAYDEGAAEKHDSLLEIIRWLEELTI